MGILDRAVIMKSVIKKPCDNPQVRIYNYGFNVNNAAVKAIGGNVLDCYDLRIVPEEKLLVFCKTDEGCRMNGSKNVYFCRTALRKHIENIIPRMEGYSYLTYIIEGEYIPEENIVVFDVKKAKRVQL